MYETAIRVAAIDGGTPPRGTIAAFTITLSETCVFDAEGERTPLTVPVGITDGTLGIQVPKYYHYEYSE